MKKLTDEEIKQTAAAYEHALKHGVNDIEYLYEDGHNWRPVSNPMMKFSLMGGYRIKPQPDPYQQFRDAEKAGKVIQTYEAQSFNGEREWCDAPKNVLKYTMTPDRYRIKPDPEYIPFTRDTIPMPCVVKDKPCRGNRYQIVEVSDFGVWLGNCDPSEHCKSFQALLENYTLDDGTPAGTLKV